MFIVENWWVDPLKDEKKRIKYIIAAMLQEEEEDDIEIITEI